MRFTSNQVRYLSESRVTRAAVGFLVKCDPCVKNVLLTERTFDSARLNDGGIRVADKPRESETRRPGSDLDVTRRIARRVTWLARIMRLLLVFAETWQVWRYGPIKRRLRQDNARSDQLRNRVLADSEQRLQHGMCVFPKKGRRG